MSRTTRVLTLGWSLVVFNCGTEEIELRSPSPLPTAPSPVPPEGQPVLVSSEELSPPGSADDGDAQPASAQDRDRVVLPESQLPSMFEVPPAPLTVPATGCRKIDFLFVIDNSDSMDEEQANLVRSFPGFIRVVQQVLKAKDFHIMVVSTGGDREDEDDPTLDPLACEDVQGAGKRRSQDGDDCGIQGGLPFMLDDQPDLEATFSCVAQVGTDGSAIEEPMDALLAATSATLNAPDRCNAGFLREDAILVATLITDEEDRRSAGDPEDWRRILLDTKAGNEDALVVLGLVGDNNLDDGLLGGPCRGVDADGSPRLQEFVSSLGGVLGSVCAPEYTPFFQTAVGWIDSTCTDFVPPVLF